MSMLRRAHRAVLQKCSAQSQRLYRLSILLICSLFSPLSFRLLLRSRPILPLLLLSLFRLHPLLNRCLYVLYLPLQVLSPSQIPPTRTPSLLYLNLFYPRLQQPPTLFLNMLLIFLLIHRILLLIR